MPRLEDLTLRMWFLIFVGCAITILAIKSGLFFWKGDYRLGVLWLVVGAGLALVFFRKKKILLTVCALTFILVSVGLTSVFHPTLVGILLTTGSAICLYMLARWSYNKFPYLGRNNWKTLFDKDPES